MLLKTSLRSFYAHKGRMLLSMIAIVLSVGFVSGTLVFSNTATSTFDRLFASTAPDVLVTQTPVKKNAGPRQDGAATLTVPASTVTQVAAQPGVKTALGQIEVGNATLVNPRTNRAAGPAGGAPARVGAWVPGPRTPLKITSGGAPAGGRQMMIDADTAARSKLGVGDPIRVINSFGTFDYTISGIATFDGTNPGAALAFLDVPTAQHDLLGAPDLFTSVAAFGNGGVPDSQLKRTIATTLGSGFDVQTAAEQKAANSKDVGSFLNFMKFAVLGFAGISLLVGGFLIVNTFSMLIAQRTREIGLLRALGGSRRQVNRSVLVEALLLGLTGSTLGLLAGLGIAQLLIGLMGSAGMKISSSLEIDATVPVASYTVGLVVTVLAAWLPARRAGRISPMAALRDHGTPADGAATRIRTVLGLALGIGGALLLALAAANGESAAGGAGLGLGVLLTLVGFVVLGPLLATGVIRVLGALLPRLFGPSGKLAQRNAMRNPRRTGATAAALMIGLALVTGFSVITSSMVSSTNAQIERSVGADYLVQANQTGVTAAMVAAAKGTPGIDHITEVVNVLTTLRTPDGQSQEISVTAVSPTITQDYHFPVRAGSAEAVTAGDAVSVDQDFAQAHHLSVGDRVTIDYGKGHTQSVPVGLITTKGNTLFDKQFYIAVATVGQALPADQRPAAGALLGKAAAGADKDRTYQALQDALSAYPQLDVKDQSAFKELYQQRVAGLLNLVYGLLGLAIIVAVLGVINTLALSVVERTREIGLLRAIGLSRRQLRRMIRLESVVIAVFGALLGTGLGLAWGVTAQQVLKSGGLQVLTVPVTTIVVVLLLSAVVGLLAALLPAFRAGRMNVLDAIATD
ncbi:ABC transporter permease [Kitasatospora sp. NPDC056181]|uniref:ABC transporter permease n=1 Tax=Kitasatospora sp. NPDC056181 TaxID=3345737 RepID=UPI0035DC6C1D